jgi:hypothetical protein
LHDRKEGWPSESSNSRSDRYPRGRGGFPMKQKGKPRRLRRFDCFAAFS